MKTFIWTVFSKASGRRLGWDYRRNRVKIWICGGHVKISGNSIQAGFGEPLKFFCRFVLLTVCSRNPGDLCNVTPNHRLNIRDKILTSAASLQGSRPHSTGYQPCVRSYRGTPWTWIYCSKTPRKQLRMFLGSSIAHTLCLTCCNCWRTCAGGWGGGCLALSCIPDTRPMRLLHWPTGTYTAPLLTHTQTGVCYYSVNTRLIDLPAGSEWDASSALRGGSRTPFSSGTDSF